MDLVNFIISSDCSSDSVSKDFYYFSICQTTQDANKQTKTCTYWFGKLGCCCFGQSGIVEPATVGLHVCRRRCCRENAIVLQSRIIPLSSSLKILGINFIKNMLCSEYINYMVSKLDKINNLLRLICFKKKDLILTPL